MNNYQEGIIQSLNWFKDLHGVHSARVYNLDKCNATYAFLYYFGLHPNAFVVIDVYGTDLHLTDYVRRTQF